MLLAVLDTETTGLTDPEIVEFAMVVVNTELEVIATYSSLIKPPKPIEPGAANVHGITDAHVQNAKTWAEYADENPEMVEHLKTAVLSGHNIRSFDIKRVMSKHFPELVCSQMLDTLEVARRNAKRRRRQSSESQIGHTGRAFRFASPRGSPSFV